jgi:hypothetical protein
VGADLVVEAPVGLGLVCEGDGVGDVEPIQEDTLRAAGVQLMGLVLGRM